MNTELIDQMEADRQAVFKASKMVSRKRQAYFFRCSEATVKRMLTGDYRRYLLDRELAMLKALEEARAALRVAAKYMNIKAQWKLSGIPFRKIENHHYQNRYKSNG